MQACSKKGLFADRIGQEQFFDPAYGIFKVPMIPISIEIEGDFELGVS